MGADARMFSPLAERLPEFDIRVPPWIPPGPCESLPTYARRLANTIDSADSCIIGGTSFGGMVALEMLGRVPARACLLIASCRSPSQTAANRALGRLALRTMPWLLTGAAQWLLRSAAPLAGRITGSGMRQLADGDRRFYRWAARAITEWQPTPPPADGPPIFHIHGSRDPLMPLRLARPDAVVEGAGHLLAMTHPDAVAGFIREKLEELDR